MRCTPRTISTSRTFRTATETPPASPPRRPGTMRPWTRSRTTGRSASTAVTTRVADTAADGDPVGDQLWTWRRAFTGAGRRALRLDRQDPVAARALVLAACGRQSSTAAG